MKKYQFKSFLVSCVVASILIGCGGGGGSSSDSTTTNTQTNNNNNNTNNNGNSNATSISGSVMDGYIQGATICLDLNKNKACDEGEPNDVTKANGAYTIDSITSEQINTYGLVVEVNENSIDEDTGEKIGSKYTLYAPVGFNHITPITTLIEEYKEENVTSIDSALSAIATKIGVDNAAKLKEDYVANGYTNIHEMAKVIARVKTKLRTAVDESAVSYDSKFIQNYINRVAIKNLPIIMDSIDSNGYDADAVTQEVSEYINTEDYDADIQLIKAEANEEAIYKEAMASSFIDFSMNSINDVSSVLTIKQNQKYRFNVGSYSNYKKVLEIEDSKNKICTVKILDTSVSKSTIPYYTVTQWKFNSFATPTSDYTVTNSTIISNAIFTVGWIANVDSSSHLDFYTYCEDKDTATTTTADLVKKKIGFAVIKELTSTTDADFDPLSLPISSSTTTHNNYYIDFNYSDTDKYGLDSAYFAGISISLGNRSVYRYTKENHNLSTISRISIDINKKTRLATIKIYAKVDGSSTLVKTVKRSFINATTYSNDTLNPAIRVVKIANETDTTFLLNTETFVSPAD